MQFSLATILLLTLVLAFVANRARPYFMGPPKWQEFSTFELKRELERGRTVVVYFRDDWWHGFDQLESDLLTKELAIAMRKNNSVMMIANETLRNPQAETELKKVSGSNHIPAIAIYSSNKSARILEDPIEAEQLVRLLNSPR